MNVFVGCVQQQRTNFVNQKYKKTHSSKKQEVKILKIKI